MFCDLLKGVGSKKQKYVGNNSTLNENKARSKLCSQNKER